MKKFAYATLAVIFLAGSAFAADETQPKKRRSRRAAPAEQSEQAETKAKTGFQRFAVYVDQGSKENHFAPSGWMGDYGDIKVNPGWTEGLRAEGGKTAIKVVYSAKMTQGAGWTGMFFQHPANNWGDKQGGYNLTGATKLTFWAKGDKGGEKLSEFKMGGITGEYPDSDSQAIGPVELTNQWQKYSIDLKGKDLSHIIGGFAWSASKDDNPNGFTVYLDDIVYE